jgi:hypothetical protein
VRQRFFFEKKNQKTFFRLSQGQQHILLDGVGIDVHREPG